MELTDTHCHIHSDFFKLDPEKVYKEAIAAGVTKAICVGTTYDDSIKAIEFAGSRDGLWASIGIHPHEAKDYVNDSARLTEFSKLSTKPKIVAVGECGLDFYYNHSPKNDQEKILRFQIELALEHGLPLIFHVREAFEAFWPIFDDYSGIRGELHSFTANRGQLEKGLSRGLYIGLNGIMTFTKNLEQLEAAKSVPLDRLLLETDSPFLTPAPYRGRICEIKDVRITAEFLAELRKESMDKLAAATTRNAADLFRLA